MVSIYVCFLRIYMSQNEVFHGNSGNRSAYCPPHAPGLYDRAEIYIFFSHIYVVTLLFLWEKWELLPHSEAKRERRLSASPLFSYYAVRTEV